MCFVFGSHMIDVLLFVQGQYGSPGIKGEFGMPGRPVSTRAEFRTLQLQ